MKDKFACDLYICCAGRAHNKNIYAKATALYNNLVQNGINCLSNFNNFKFDEKIVETVSKSKLFLLVTDGDILTDSVGALLKNAPVYPVVSAFYKRFFNGANFGYAKVLSLSECVVAPERLHVIFSNTSHFVDSDGFLPIINWVSEYKLAENKSEFTNEFSLDIVSNICDKKETRVNKCSENRELGSNKTKKVKNIKKATNSAVNSTILNNQSDMNGYIIDGDKLIKYTGHDKYIAIPSGIKEICARAFYNNENIVCVKLSNSVEVIGEYAFADCKNIVDFYFAGSLNRIERGAFSNDVSLKMIDFDKTLSFIGENAFWGCNSLFPILIPLSVKEIGANAFDGIKYFIVRCEHSYQPKGFHDGWEGLGDPYWLGLDSKPNDENSENDNWVQRLIDMPMKPSKSRGKDGMNYFSSDFHVINGELVYVKRDLEIIEIPSGTKSIAQDLFSDRVNLKKVVFPKSLVKIGRGAFAKTGLEELVIPPNIKEIEDYAFFGCKSLKSVKFSKGVKVLNHAIFANCEKLCEVNIPLSVESISTSIFYGCNNLMKIKIPASVIGIEEDAFLGLDNCVITIYDGADKNFAHGWNSKCKVLKINL